jgi:hypothetical protein
MTKLERLARDKHFSLLQKSVNYDHKKFYSTAACFDKFVVKFQPKKQKQKKFQKYKKQIRKMLFR